MPVTPKFVEESGLWLIDASAPHDDKTFTAELCAAIDNVRDGGGEKAQLWIHEITDETDQIAQSCGAVAYRDLWVLVCDLPVTRSDARDPRVYRG